MKNETLAQAPAIMQRSSEARPIDAQGNSYRTNEEFLRDLLRRWVALTRRRPRRLYEIVLRCLTPGEVRRIIRLDSGLLYYTNAFNHIGSDILARGSYESENDQLFARHIRPGNVVVDVGANEGYFTTVFGVLAGPKGCVIAVEPQSRLCDLIEINCRLNGVTNFKIFQRALGRSGAGEALLALYSGLNTGMSSLVTSYRSTTGYEKVSFIAIEEIMTQCGIDHIDVIKIDTEGFEVEIIYSMLDMIKSKRITRILVDYHESILRTRGLSSENVDTLLGDVGMHRIEGSAVTPDGYVVYERR